MYDGRLWDRVHGPDLDPDNAKRRKLNIQIFNSKTFIDACKLVKIDPTIRQASKFRHSKGVAYQGIQ